MNARSDCKRHGPSEWAEELEAALRNIKTLVKRCGGRSDMLPWHLHQAEEALKAALRTERRRERQRL
jgi:hypothetical protein